MQRIKIQTSDFCRLEMTIDTQHPQTVADPKFVCWITAWKDIPVAFSNINDALDFFADLKNKRQFLEYAPMRVNEGAGIVLNHCGNITVEDEVFLVIEREGAEFPRLYKDENYFSLVGIDIEGESSLFPAKFYPNTMPVELRLCKTRNRIKTLQKRVDDARKDYEYQTGLLEAAKQELKEIEAQYVHT